MHDFVLVNMYNNTYSFTGIENMIMINMIKYVNFFANWKTFIFVTGNPSDQSSLRSSKVQCRGTETDKRDIGVEDVMVW